ncbi:NHLP bacteriocin export ABC transporter permease/ATPase subunit (plasmid) [Anabaena sp. FACHB-709]|uniref:ABC transporter ATP-binding protein n=2 Tax=Nostocaceae TaxID=1162 RepID=A0A1Z4KVE4_ANAVA|nr:MULTISPECIES: NHLP bacteriocin export ABC transporter permease/ATPase subunit [Nostocaceae]BAY72898.1 ABC transporter ATP-binding protein [Trichormus variabilis NIES-23]MBD2175141.1 NHLP bacteriocin export ABC transporter permease/ATPase subunit [Anabaena cylindrica FACHB-318]MBD2266871.1 NHLP bacteriocin export ABC transporter permease/ATPase subunit [Anabaena sp. FACHB-709]MBD2276488.1 NHLP bacteriocin export ABC transporter permease/ATPase subunit [Nostoc sp. PCC 7120 = FACHB-418]MBD2287
MTEKALRELASVLNPAANLPQGETPLLVAVGAVGKALGITIRPPAKTEILLSGLPETLLGIARASGFRIRRVTLIPNWWKTDCGSLVAFTQAENRPVALLRVKANKYEILDSVDLTYTPVNRQTAAQLAPIAYTFYRPLPDKEITFLDMLQFTLRGSTADLLKILWVGVFATLFGMFTPQITGILIDYAIPDANRQLLIEMGLGLLAASFGVTIFQLTQAFAILRVQTQVSYDTQAAVWDRLLKLKPAFFRSYSTGDLYNRVSAMTQIRNRLSGSILRTLFTSIFSLLNLGLLLIYSFPLALVAMAIALVIVLITTIISLLTRRKLRPLQQLSGDILGLTVQLIGGVSKLRVAAAESEAFAYWAKKYTQQVKLMLSTQFIEDVLTTFNVMLPAVSSIALFGLSVSLLGKAEGGTGLSTGTFLAFNTAFGTFIASATRLSNTLIDILEITILWERTQPILKTKPEVDADKFHPGKLSGEIKLNQVSFRYRQDSPLVLENIALEAKAGEFIAIVGASGSGKSTVLRLLLGFETPEAGTISYDGRDLSGLDIAAVRRQLGVVLQNGRIMSGSIWENIAGGAIVTQDEAWSALQMAGLAEDVEAMPMGIHTIISEGGGNVSGGQRQRLFIARALVHKPQILLFDEATSALDNRTQAIVTQSLAQLGVTRVVIAHRLSTIRHADMIYVLQAGKIVQQGSFEELAAVEGLFANLMARQR